MLFILLLILDHADAITVPWGELGTFQVNIDFPVWAYLLAILHAVFGD